MQGIIIYDSKYGATRQYAEWLGTELNLPFSLSHNITKKQIDEADYLLIGTPVYFGKFRIRRWLRKNAGNINNKKLFFFIVNATAPDEQERRDKFAKDNIGGEIRNKCEIYFLPGRLIHKNLTPFDKLMVKMGERAIKDPVKRNGIRSDLDNVKKENIVKLIERVNNYCSERSQAIHLARPFI